LVLAFTGSFLVILKLEPFHLVGVEKVCVNVRRKHPTPRDGSVV
jgi:hypothetical protein